MPDKGKRIRKRTSTAPVLQSPDALAWIGAFLLVQHASIPLSFDLVRWEGERMGAKRIEKRSGEERLEGAGIQDSRPNCFCPLGANDFLDISLALLLRPCISITPFNHTFGSWQATRGRTFPARCVRPTRRARRHFLRQQYQSTACLPRPSRRRCRKGG